MWRPILLPQPSSHCWRQASDRRSGGDTPALRLPARTSVIGASVFLDACAASPCSTLVLEVLVDGRLTDQPDTILAQEVDLVLALERADGKRDQFVIEVLQHKVPVLAAKHPQQADGILVALWLLLVTPRAIAVPPEGLFENLDDLFLCDDEPTLDTGSVKDVMGECPHLAIRAIDDCVAAASHRLVVASSGLTLLHDESARVGLRCPEKTFDYSVPRSNKKFFEFHLRKQICQLQAENIQGSSSPCKVPYPACGLHRIK